MFTTDYCKSLTGCVRTMSDLKYPKPNWFSTTPKLAPFTDFLISWNDNFNLLSSGQNLVVSHAESLAIILNSLFFLISNIQNVSKSCSFYLQRYPESDHFWPPHCYHADTLTWIILIISWSQGFHLCNPKACSQHSIHYIPASISLK